MAAKTGSIFDNLEQLGEGSAFIDEISNMLERVEMFRDFDRLEVESFAKYTQAFAAPKGAKVLLEGGKESYMFFITEGKLDILKSAGDDAIEKKIATVRAGKSVGEMSLIDGLPHSASARVVDDAKVIMVTKNNFEKFNQVYPEVALKLMKKIAVLMSLRLRQTSGVLIDYLEG